MSAIDVGGVATYYERHGSGGPVLLLHGGLGSAENFSELTSTLAGHHEVWVPERYGHGRTPDTAAPFTYDDMAAQTVAFLDAVGVESAHVVGYSDGANIGLLLASRSPSRIERLVSISGNFAVSALTMPPPGSRGDLTALFAELTETYERLSPDGPDHLSTIKAKSNRMWQDWTGIPLADLAAITCPTLVVGADADVVTLEHTVALFQAIPDAELAVVPGTSHNLIHEKPAMLAALLLAFLHG